MRDRLGHLVRAAVLVIVAACCVAPGSAGPASAAGPVWPAAPDKPRIAFVASFADAQDLGIRRGFFQRALDLVFGREELRLVRPMAVAAAADVIFVADPGAQGVHRFDRAAGTHELILGPGKRALPSPVGLALGASGEVYVTDSALAGVFVIRPGAREAVALPLSAKIVQPTGIAFDAQSKRLIVVDTGSHHVNAFDTNGALIFAFGKRGAGDGEFNYPTMAWRAANGTLYVTDALNFRVQAFDAGGRFLSKFGRLGDGGGDLPRQKGVATDSFAHVYIVDAIFHALQVFDGQGRFLLSVGGMGQGPGEFWLPTGLFIAPDDTIYIADSYNRRVQVLRYIGGPT